MAKSTKCPTCKTTLIKATFGAGAGFILRNRYIHVQAESGDISIACPRCKTLTVARSIRVVKR